MSEKNKKMICSKCGRRGLFYHDYNNTYWCAMCGASTNPDGTTYIAPPRQYYICPRCGKGCDYADKDQAEIRAAKEALALPHRLTREEKELDDAFEALFEVK